jgi:hypothetical protein
MIEHQRHVNAQHETCLHWGMYRQQTPLHRPWSVASLTTGMMLFLLMCLVPKGVASSPVAPLPGADTQNSSISHAQPSCSLQLSTTPLGLITGSIQCRAPGLTVSAGAALSDRLQTDRNVQLLPTGCGPATPPGCLLTICSNLSQPITFTSTSVIGVAAPGSSGVVCIAGSSRLAFEGCDFAANSAAGSTLVVSGTAQANLTSCRLVNNRGSQGGALKVTGQAAVQLVDTTISNNTATEGGGLYAAGAARLTLTASILVGNTARRADSGACGGGGTWLADSTVMFVEGSRLVNNTAVCDAARGGAVALWGSAQLVMRGSAMGPSPTPGTTTSSSSSSGRTVVVGNTATSNNTQAAPATQARRGTNTDPGSSTQDSAGDTEAAAPALGGAILAAGHSPLQLTDTLLVNNTVSSLVGTVGGGAVALTLAASGSLGPGVVVEGNKALGMVAYGAGAWALGRSRLTAEGAVFQVGALQLNSIKHQANAPLCGCVCECPVFCVLYFAKHGLFYPQHTHHVQHEYLPLLNE